jgi:type III secretion protein N (ATPase)
MIARNAVYDAGVIALIGERGREVREFLEDCLGSEGRRRSVVVVATSDASPIERVRAAFAATAIAEALREQGKEVLLLLDSITRFARAQREIGMARGEPPTRRGFPPSLFTALPQLFERVGPVGSGAITAFYTVLMEDDATPDPVAEEVRSLLDGHLVLSRRLAQQSIYPAIDSTQSLSRLMTGLVSSQVMSAAQKVRELLSKRAEIELLVQVGEYERGHDKAADEALDRHEAILTLHRQSVTERVSLEDSLAALAGASGQPVPVN